MYYHHDSCLDEIQFLPPPQIFVLVLIMDVIPTPSTL